MYLYRIEHIDTRQGPYKGSSIPFSNHSCKETHPTMWYEFNLESVMHNMSEYYCAFNSTEKMLTWFAGYFPRLRANGFVIGVYVATEMQHGAVQSIFHMPTAERVDEFPIDVVL